MAYILKTDQINKLKPSSKNINIKSKIYQTRSQFFR